MSKNKNEVEELNNEQAENISGGFVGSDWGRKSANIYKILGIEHEKNIWGYDKYRIDGYEIPKEFAYASKDAYNKTKSNNEDDDAREDILFRLDYLKHILGTDKGDEALREIWEKWG